MNIVRQARVSEIEEVFLPPTRVYGDGVSAIRSGPSDPGARC